MSERSRPSSVGSGKVGLSVVLGLILVPLSAVAAVALVRGAAPETPIEAEVDGATMVEAALVGADAFAIEATYDPGAITAEDPAADLVAACGYDGRSLVDAETAGTITRVQKGALDALRDVCAAAGLPLPDPLHDPVTVAAGPAASPATTVTTAPPALSATTDTTVASPPTTAGQDDGWDDYDDDEHHEDRDHDDDEHEDRDDDRHGDDRDDHEEGD